MKLLSVWCLSLLSGSRVGVESLRFKRSTSGSIPDESFNREWSEWEAGGKRTLKGGKERGCERRDNHEENGRRYSERSPCSNAQSARNVLDDGPAPFSTGVHCTASMQFKKKRVGIHTSPIHPSLDQLKSPGCPIEEGSAVRTCGVEGTRRTNSFHGLRFQFDLCCFKHIGRGKHVEATREKFRRLRQIAAAIAGQHRGVNPLS
jgi:hypothetical protein